MTKDSELFRSPDAPVADRVEDLISRLTLEEKIKQVVYYAAAVERLGIPAYNYWSEALHGVARNGKATVFPQAIGMASTFNPELVRTVASAIADEGRAKFHETLRRRGGTGMYQGLTFWSPNVNLFRDPRWGRGQETWGEDPYLTGEMGAAYVRGLQGDHPKYLKAAACAKHYAVHSGPEKDRHTFNAIVSQRDLYDSYLPAFEKLVTEAKVESVMGAYNRTLDEPCCASKLLLGTILREKWGFSGHVVSDCGAISDFHTNHKVTRDGAESAALGVRNGCDLACDGAYEKLGEAVERGLVSEAEIDVAVARLLTTRMKLGLFDPDESVPFASTPMSVVCSAEHRELAYEAAVQSIVLLKNRNDVLPIPSDTKSLLVVGPTATDLAVLLGNYHGLNASLTTLVEGIVGGTPEGIKLEYRPGCQLIHPNENPTDWSPWEAANSSYTIACVGISPLMEGEEGDAILTKENGDRTEIGLPSVQVEYLKKLAAQKAKIILVVTGGSPIALGEVEELCEAIVFVWYPGQEGGRAVADVLFGRRSPAGRLPLTFYRSLADLPPFDDYAMAGRTYRYFEGKPLFPFGFGLSYTEFAYRALELSKREIGQSESVTASVEVTNEGKVASDEVVQLYVSRVGATCPSEPRHHLESFARVHLAPGEKKKVAFSLTPRSLSRVEESGERRVVPGSHRVFIGGGQPGHAAGASAELVVR
jgi:beta-glucosidase